MFKLLTSGSLLLALGSFCLGIISLLLSLYLYNKSRNFKKINYAKKGHTLMYNFKPNIDKLSLEYDGNVVENVTVTFLAMWNSGNDTIYSSDVLNTAPLSVYPTDDSQILETKIVYSSNKLNGFQMIKADKDGFVISFDYINKKEGIILKIVHTGTSSKSIAATCHIKGVENPSLVKFIDKGVRLLYEEDNSGILSVLSVILGIIETIIFFKFVNLNITSNFFSIAATILAATIFSVITRSFFIFIMSKLAPKSWPPLNDFDIYREIYRKKYI